MHCEVHLHFLGVGRGGSDGGGSDEGDGGSCGEAGGSGVGERGSDDGGDGGGGGEATRLRSKDSSRVSLSVPRKTSGAARFATAVDGEAGVPTAAAAFALLLAIRAARWLALDATSVAVARFLGAAGSKRPL